jgi:hypothetical protein
MTRDSREGVTPSPCTNCGKVMDAASVAGKGDDTPTPGDITICFYCHHLMAFADDMTIRDLTDEEIKECAGDPTLVVAMKALARFKQLEREGKL